MALDFGLAKQAEPRLFVVGDIHGMFDLLEHELEQVCFNKEIDTLVSVGDLVDRGPDSLAALEYIKQPWFKAVMGNHEAFLHPNYAGSYIHVMNGGDWYRDFADEVGEENANIAIRPLLQLPVWREETHNGKKFGFIHASLCGLRDWNLVPAFAEKHDKFGEHPMLWDRSEVMGAKTAHFSGVYADEFWVQNVEHVYFGHTPLKGPITVGNCTWLDTGAFATNKLTIMECV